MSLRTSAPKAVTCLCAIILTTILTTLKKGWVRDTKEFYNTAIAVADNSCFGGLYIYLFLSQLVPPEEWPEGQVVSSERLTLAHCKAYTYKTRMANLKEEEEAKVLMN